MNLCGRISLVDGARYIVFIDLVYCIVSITVITLQLINTSVNGLAINSGVDSVSPTSILNVLVAYLMINVLNILLAGLLYNGLATDDLKKCRVFIIISIISTIGGFAAVIYHGIQLSELSLSIFSSEFFLSALYHLYKVYAICVVVSHVRELDKLINSYDVTNVSNRFRYQTLESTSNEDRRAGDEADVAKHIIFNMAFSAKHYVEESSLKIDYDASMEYEDTTSTVTGSLNLQSGSGPLSDNSKRSVAVKLLKSNFRSEKHMIALVKEAQLMSHIGHHEHILQFIGVCYTGSEVCKGNVMLITEWYPARRLDDFLRSSAENQLQNFQNLVVKERIDSEKSSKRRLGTLYQNTIVSYLDLEPFSTVNMIQWAYQLSSAMEFLHGKNIILGNLQAKSLVLVKVSRIKLSNFGLASELHEENNLITSLYLSEKISWRWTAMECLCSANKGLPTKFSEKTDVWSYAATLWEIFSMGQPPNMAPNLSDHVNALGNGKRLGKPEYASEGIHKLLLACWHEKASERPGFNVIALFFRQLLSKSIENL